MIWFKIKFVYEILDPQDIISNLQIIKLEGMSFLEFSNKKVIGIPNPYKLGFMKEIENF